MACSGLEYTFAGVLLCSGLAALIGAWYYSSFLKILELRHPGAYQFLGRPHIFNGESDRQNTAIMLFIRSCKHESLGDMQLSRTILVLRACAAAEFSLLFTILGCLLLAPLPEDMIMLGCWRR